MSQLTKSNDEFLSHWYKLDDYLVYAFRKFITDLFKQYFAYPKEKRDLLNSDFEMLFDFYVSLDDGRYFPRKDSKGKHNVTSKRKRPESR